MDDLIRRAKALLKLQKRQQKWLKDRCEEYEIDDPFKETIAVLQGLIKLCEPKKRKTSKARSR